MKVEEEEKTKSVKKGTTKKTSSTRTKVKTELSNEELLESILNKKKEKKTNKTTKKSTKDFSLINMSVDEIDKLSGDEILDSVSKSKSSTKKSTKKTTTSKTTTSKTTAKKKTTSSKSDLSSDELLEQIMAKKKSKKSSSKKTTTKPKEEIFSIEETKEEIVIVDDKEDKKIELPKKVVSKEEEEPEKVEEEIDYLSPDSPLNKNYDEQFGKQIDSENGQKVAAIVVILLIIGIIILIIGALKFGYLKLSYSKVNETDVPEVQEIPEETDTKEIIVDDREERYNECLTRSLNKEDKNAYMKSVEEELTSYLSKYRTSVLYYDLTYGYKYTYNESGTYYAASTIKLLDALYIYTKAAEGKLSLDTKLTYTSRYARAGSKEMKKHKYGDKISLRNLVKYELSVSDNSSHHMLFDYIGYKNLNDFGAKLGATRTLSAGEYYGNINLSNAFAYVKYLYEFTEKYPKLGKELLVYMTSSEQNNIALKEHKIKAASKYGEYSSYYHNIGIVNAEHPYILIVLTKEGTRNFRSIVHDISLHTYKLNTSFYQNRKDVCQVEIYED